MTGAELKKNRQRVNLTQKKLGELLGYKDCSAERVIQLWEHDKQPIPLQYFRALSKILEVPLEDFIP